jgi:hypothetical protein
MSMKKAMKAAHADVLGHEVPRLRRTRGQSSRNLAGRRAMFTRSHARTTYRGASPHRDTQVWNGHPMNGLWTTWRGAQRSSKPAVRALAKAKLKLLPEGVFLDEMAGVRP